MMLHSTVPPLMKHPRPAALLPPSRFVATPVFCEEILSGGANPDTVPPFSRHIEV
jgi:hypothetical protein